MSEESHEAEENSERWLLTYADMITLLMAFFLMMYSMSIVNMGKFQELATSVRSGFNGKEVGFSSDTLGIGSQTQVLESVLPAGSFELMSHIEGQVKRQLPGNLSSQVDVVSEGGTVTLRVRADNVLFPRGSADLSPNARTTLSALAKIIKPLHYETRIEGHTCNLPISSTRYPTNWNLSAERAITVLIYMITAQKFTPTQLSAVGYADTKPVVPNTSEANRSRNRRIDIVLVRPTGNSAPDIPTEIKASLQTNISPSGVDITNHDLTATPATKSSSEAPKL